MSSHFAFYLFEAYQAYQIDNLLPLFAAARRYMPVLSPSQPVPSVLYSRGDTPKYARNDF